MEPAQTILDAAGLKTSQANLATRLTATLALSVSSVAPRVARARPKPQPLRRVCAAFSQSSLCLCGNLMSGDRLEKVSIRWREGTRTFPTRGGAAAADIGLTQSREGQPRERERLEHGGAHGGLGVNAL